ncbi:MAG: Na+/H+ antiporter subunit E [Desulfobulbaceae bacterium]|nr:Na+/H+ antiporter subunit E [Desulfobulbaceae bacterium]
MVNTPRPKSALLSLLYPVMLRIFFFTMIWLSLSKGEFYGGLPFAVPAILIACWLGMNLRGPEAKDIHLGVLLLHLPFFFYKSTMSGLDVMRRALHPQLPIDPVLVEFYFSLPKGNPRVFLADIITLLPGTISVDMDEEKIIVHALDPHMARQSDLRRLERKVAGLYRIDNCSWSQGL